MSKHNDLPIDDAVKARPETSDAKDAANSVTLHHPHSQAELPPVQGDPDDSDTEAREIEQMMRRTDQEMT